jgi:hypothetical protein
MVGGKHYNYDPFHDGNPQLNPQTDALASGGPVGTSGPQTGIVNNKDSWQDRLRPDPGNGSGNGQNALLNSVNGQLTYAFWLRVNQATSLDDPTRTHANASILIGRSNASGNAGGVYIRDKDGVANGAVSDYVLNLSTPSGQTGSASTLVFGRNQWNHWVVTFDMGDIGNNGSSTIYRNGGLLAGGAEEFFTGRGLGTINGLFRLNNEPGGSQNGSGDFIIDDLAVWQSILSPQDVKRLYELGVATAVVPEPSSVVLAMMGLASLLAFRRRKRA